LVEKFIRDIVNIGKADVVGVAKRATLFWKIWHQNGAGRISYRAIGAARRAKERKGFGECHYT
jgi:hypothetical protein